jgi:hypothetical protein
MINHVTSELYVCAADFGPHPAQDHGQSTRYNLAFALQQHSGTLGLGSGNKGLQDFDFS